MVEYAMQHASEVGEGLEVLPGVRNLLEVLARQDDVIIGLVRLFTLFRPLLLMCSFWNIAEIMYSRKQAVAKLISHQNLLV